MIDDLTIYIVIATALIYLIVYLRNRFIGDILFFGIGLGMWSLLDSSEGWLGLIIMIGALIALIYDTVNIMDKNQQNIGD